MIKSKLIEHRLLDIAFVGGGIDSAVGAAHFSAVGLDKKFRVVAGCFARTSDANNASGNHYRIAPERVYSSAEALLAAEKNRIDAVVILTPTDQHLAHIKLFLEQGVPVICEKALTCTSAEAQDIVALVQRTSGFLSVIFNYTGYPILREIKNFIRVGRLGRITQINVDMPQEGYLRVDKDLKPINVQGWRLKTSAEVPIVSLDLGVHLHSIVGFLTSARALSAVALSRSNGHFEGVDDNVLALVQYTNKLDVKMWYGKTALGYRNGLRIEAMGTAGAVSWVQENPEVFAFADHRGDKRIYDRGCAELVVSRLQRYQRFKAGHPAGFIEALANYYWDVAEALSDYKATGQARYFPDSDVFNAEFALEGMRLMEAIHRSSKLGKWVPVETQI